MRYEYIRIRRMFSRVLLQRMERRFPSCFGCFFAFRDDERDDREPSLWKSTGGFAQSRTRSCAIELLALSPNQNLGVLGRLVKDFPDSGCANSDVTQRATRNEPKKCPVQSYTRMYTVWRRAIRVPLTKRTSTVFAHVKRKHHGMGLQDSGDQTEPAGSQSQDSRRN